MSDATQVLCCGRPMSSIGVQQATSGLELLSCASCGQHAWRSEGKVVDRDQLLKTLTVHKPSAARPAEPERPAAEPDDAERRAELQRLLSTFQVHGSTS